MTRSAVRRLDWSLGCGTFAHVISGDGSSRAVETLWFTEREAGLVLLESGEREILPWRDAQALVRVLSTEAACAEVGMPVPGRIRLAGGWRRVDPFHTERHRSARFRALTALIRHRRLPCRYSLLHFAEGATPGEWSGPCVEDPEQTAANVAERLARDADTSIAAALETELLADAVCAVSGTRAARALLERAGWDAVLADLDTLLAGYGTAPLPTSHAAPTTGAAQLALFDEGSR